MQIIIISPNNTSHRHWHLSRQKVIMLVGSSLLLVAALAYFISLQLELTVQSHTPITILKALPINGVETSQQEAKINLDDYYAKRLGQLQGESIRLAALTQKIAEIAGVDTREFLLNSPAALGGIDDNGEFLSPKIFNKEMTLLNKRYDQHHLQLSSLQNLFITRDNITSAIPQGRPVKGGYLSSAYGYRIDPFSGKKTFHSGIDFAAKEGSNVMAVADGLVSYTGKRPGYGQIVELEHGNGYVTRYGHNKKILVKTGDKIIKGVTIALVGSTGRSTGPHVHFEVLREGKKINPYKFVKR
jgi:murein DD-endopeptidase MepM/ murein hydrolase activator NlpD